MNTLQEKTKDFQLALAKDSAVEVTPEVSTEVLHSIQTLKELSINRFAQRSVLSYKTARNYIKGERSPSFPCFIRILNRLGYTVVIKKMES